MTLNVVTSFKPSIYEETTGRWTVNGYSWIKHKAVSEHVKSPSLIKAAGFEFGIELFPGGYNEESNSADTVSIYSWCKGGPNEMNVQFEIRQLGSDGTIARRWKTTITASGNYWYSAEGKHELWGWNKADPKEAFEARLKDDTAIFELAVTVWSEASVAGVHDTNEGDCDAVNTTQLSADIGQLLLTQEHTDVALRVSDSDGEGGKVLHAHRIILAARSPVFKKMFFGEGMRESLPGAEVSMCDVTLEVAQEFLHSLYTGEIRSAAWDDEELLCHVFSMFHKYEVHELFKRCEGRVMKRLSAENVAERLMMSDLLDIPALRSAALDFIVSSPSQLANVQATDGFQRLIEQRPKILAEILSKAVPGPKRSRPPPARELPANWEDLRVGSLKELLSDRALPTNGSKQILVARLQDWKRQSLPT